MVEANITIGERQFDRVCVITNHMTVMLVNAVWKPADPADPCNKDGRNGQLSGLCEAGTEVSRFFQAIHRRNLSGELLEFDCAHLDKLAEVKGLPTFELCLCG